MTIQFCGAAQNVTGSSHLITLDDGFKILLDCGLFQGRGRKVWERNNEWLFKPAEIDCLVLSHAHIDHCGRIPQLVKDGFTGDIYATHATRSLCAIMLLDSAKIQERDVEYYNKRMLKKKKRKDRVLRQPLYKSENVTDAMQQFIGEGYDRPFKVHPNVTVSYRDAGHILGSASVRLEIMENGKKTVIGFSGDIGRPNRPILRDPLQMDPVDYMICESTYGDKEHESPPQQSNKFLNVIKKCCVEDKGKLIIPAFSLGRTQEIVYMLDKMETAGVLPKIPIYVDSPLAVNATTVFGAHPECFDDELNEYLLIDDNPFGFNELKYIRNVDESKSLNESREPCIIISSSGMMNAGRVKHHLANNIENPKNTLLIVGYCAPYTPGGMLRAGVESIRLFGEEKQVRMNIEIMDSFSAHADRLEIHEFLSNQKKTCKKIFLVHGDLERQTKFKDYLNDRDFDDVEIPAPGDIFEV